MFRHLFPVDEQVTGSHHSFERDCDTFILIYFRQLEITPVPTYTVVNNVSSAMFLLQLHHMGQCNRHPG